MLLSYVGGCFGGAVMFGLLLLAKSLMTGKRDPAHLELGEVWSEIEGIHAGDVAYRKELNGLVDDVGVYESRVNACISDGQSLWKAVEDLSEAVRRLQGRLDDRGPSDAVPQVSGDAW